MAPRNPDQTEIDHLTDSFPGLNIAYVKITVEVDVEARNCVAYALDEDEHIEPESVAKMRGYFVGPGKGYYEVPAGSPGADIDLLGVAGTAKGANLSKVYVKHVTRKYPHPRPAGVPTDVELWESKLGPGDMAMTHRRFDLCMSGHEMQQLGGVIASFKRL